MTRTHIKLDLDRGGETPLTTDVSGIVFRENLRYHIRDFQSDLVLKPEERDVAEKRLVEKYLSR